MYLKIWGEILRNGPILDLEEVYTLVSREALQQETMTIYTDIAAMVAKNTSTPQRIGKIQKNRLDP